MSQGKDRFSESQWREQESHRLDHLCSEPVSDVSKSILEILFVMIICGLAVWYLQ